MEHDTDLVGGYWSDAEHDLAGLGEIKEKTLSAIVKYQAARAFLFSYDRFEDVPFRGERRFESPHARKLLLRREDAPAFGLLLWAFRQATT